MDRKIVAGDDARREDHRVALAEADMGMLVVGDTGERGARLTLAACAKIEDPPGRELRRFLLVDDGREALEVPGLARRIGDLVHRAANQRDLAAVGLRCLRNGLETGNVGGKGGNRDAAPE